MKNIPAPGSSAPEKTRGLPALPADMILIHPPAWFDFRECRDVYFPFLGTSGDVPITPLYEYFPLGFKTLQRYLGERGHSVKIINMSTLLLRFPQIDIDQVIQALDTPLIGIDLHWLVHVQGALALAERIKKQRPEIKIIFGGLSTSYFADQLFQYPFVDMVMPGYDTHAPMDRLLSEMKRGGGLQGIPNLIWRGEQGVIHDNGLTHLPEAVGVGVDWRTVPKASANHLMPFREIVCTHSAGCGFNCQWCGGSRDTFRRIFGSRRTLLRKPDDEISYEFQTLQDLQETSDYHLYDIGAYNETPARMRFFLDHVVDARLRSVSYEQFYLTPDDILIQMARANSRTTITLSPESHDFRISKLAGRGAYTNQQMEAWIERALAFGIYQIDIWYFVGMPEQDEKSVYETVAYCQHLLNKFKGQRVHPFICPMIPFLDPGSNYFENPAPNGYRLFHRTLEEHRRGMERASITNRINYETRWLTRRQLVDVGFRSVEALMTARAEAGHFPASSIARFNQRVEDALAFNAIVEAADNLANLRERARALADLGDEILKRNRAIFFSGVANQAFPINRQIGGRWFDEMGWEASVLVDSIQEGTS